jgi:hypothetical protein
MKDWGIKELRRFKAQLDSGNVYPYDLEVQPELSRAKWDLVEAAEVAFKNYICER